MENLVELKKEELKEIEGGYWWAVAYFIMSEWDDAVEGFNYSVNEYNK